MTEYKLSQQKDATYDGPGWGEPRGTFPTLAAAMEAAGHPDPSHWLTTAGIPGVITVDWVHYYDPARAAEYEETGSHLFIPWTIEAPGVADEYTDLLVPDFAPGA